MAGTVRPQLPACTLGDLAAAAIAAIATVSVTSNQAQSLYIQPVINCVKFFVVPVQSLTTIRVPMLALNDCLYY